jgi:uncharacterized membrane protein HdeD (DUF308 family)
MSMTQPAPLNKNWMLHLLEGVLLVVLGLAALVLPRTLAIDILFGWLFLISGIAGMVTAMWIRQGASCFWSIVSATLAIVAGILLLLSPRGVLSLTLILILFFVIEGVASIMHARGYRRENSGQWRWMMAGGVLDLAFAVAIVVGLPGSAQWALGLLVGINFIFCGLALVAMALQVRSAVRE